MQTKSWYTCGASLIDVGVVCCVVATGVIMMDRAVKKRSGTEPPFVPPSMHSVNGKPLHRARFEYTWTHPRHLRGHDAVGSGPFAKPGNYTHRQWPGSHSTFSGFADIAGTSSQYRVPL